MAQSKLSSLKESCVNILIGYTINFVANLVVLPLFGHNITIKDNLWLGLIFTVISIIRSYLIRRFFNKKEVSKCR